MEEYIATRFSGFSLISYEELESTIVFTISNDHYTATCPCCGVESKYIHQEFKKEIFDSSYNGKKVVVKFIQRRYKCKNKHCKQGHFIEYLSFIDGKRPYSKYVVDEIMKNKDKSIRTNVSIINEKHKIEVCKDTIARIINDHKDDNEYKDIVILKLDKNKLEQNIDERIDALAEVSYTSSDYITEMVDNKYSLIDEIKNAFKNITEYQTTYSPELFIIAGIVTRLKRLTATSSMPLAFTNVSSIRKMGYNFLKKRPDGTYFSSGAFRDYLLNTDENKLQEAFNEYNYQILNKNNIKPNIHILDATDIEVNMYNGNYEKATCATDDDGKRIKGYKLSALYGYYEDQLVLEGSNVTTLNVHDLKAGEDLINNKNIKRGDLLLIDRGYLSFDVFYNLKEKGIYIVTPAKKNSEIIKTALSLVGVQIKDQINKKDNINQKNSKGTSKTTTKWLKHPNKTRKNQEYCLVKDIKVYDDATDTKTCRTYDVNGALIRFEKKYKESDSSTTYYEDEKYCYALIYTTDTTKEGKEIIELYEKRMKIEDQFKQLKSYYDLNKLTSTKYKFIVFQILTTINALGLVQLFTTLKEGKEFKNSYLKTIIAKLDCIGKYNKTDIIIASKDVFAIYKFSESLEMFRTKNEKVQQEFIRHARLFESGAYESTI